MDLTAKELQEIRESRPVRRRLAKNSHLWFFSIYLSRYMKYGFAPFHYQIFHITENEDLKIAVLVAFRGSGKSTLMTLSYVLWSILGKQKRKFVLILSQTQNQARLHLTNIKNELENNELLKADIGPFEEVSDEWGANSIVLSYHNARIMVASSEQSIRGIRHGENRPDLVICDDIEDLASVKNKDGRDKTYNWFSGEVLPIGDKESKIVIVGNLLHEDSLLMRLKNSIENGSLNAKFFAYPLLDDKDTIAWHAKFKNMEQIEELKKKQVSDSAWYREYLLRIISDTDRLVHPEWIHYYDELPSEKNNNFRYTATGIDLAISDKDSADFTAMVSAKIFGYDDEFRAYILPHPVNERMDFPKTFDTAKNLSEALGGGDYTKLFIEDVGYQKSLVQHLEDNNIPAEGVTVGSQDKRSRLALVTHLIKQGKILFPRKGCETLILQLTSFGVEKHDDLADAFSLLAIKILEDANSKRILFAFIGRSPDDDDGYFYG